MARDLLFVSSFGEGNAREIALAHFTDESDKGDLPTLRVLGWDDDDTPMQLGYVAQTLRDKLRWPANTASKADQEWRTQWASAFTLRLPPGHQRQQNAGAGAGRAGQTHPHPRQHRAGAGKRQRPPAPNAQGLQGQPDCRPVDDGFADMFAQTITYGLFHRARQPQQRRAGGRQPGRHGAQHQPVFERPAGQTFCSAGAAPATSANKRVDFDELGINEVVTVLRDVPMDAVLRSFNASKAGRRPGHPLLRRLPQGLRQEAMRAKRGVFYTPAPWCSSSCAAWTRF
jgi:hypothetical protein